MSNSIWKTGYPKYEHDRSWDDIIQEYHREDGSKFYVVGYCSEPNDRWTYLTDIIAQADKAERLEEENEAMREEFEVWHGNHKCVLEDNERLQKALEVAKMSLEDCNKILSADMKDWGYLTAEIALKKIEQMIGQN